MHTKNLMLLVSETLSIKSPEQVGANSFTPDVLPSGYSLEDFVKQTRGLTISQVVSVIPKSCFKRDITRAWLGVATSVGATSFAYYLIAINPYPWLLPFLWFFAGTAAWGLFTLGHECGHHSFSHNRTLNNILGHLMLTPLLYPFHSWQHLHNFHHTHTNSLEEDVDWLPMGMPMYAKTTWTARLIHLWLHSWGWWSGSLLHWMVHPFNKDSFPKPREWAEVRFSILWVVLFASVVFPTLYYYTGFWGIIKYYVMPWLVYFACFSTFTLLHHTDPEIPILDRYHWSPVASNLTTTIHCNFPGWIELLSHDINVHIPHHLAPGIPFYHLRTAHAALKAHYPALVHETTFSWSLLHRVLVTCHLFHRPSGLYISLFK